MSIVAYNIKRIISNKGLKQTSIAARAGFNENQFSAMLCGRKKILADYIPRIALALDVGTNELFEPEISTE